MRNRFATQRLPRYGVANHGESMTTPTDLASQLPYSLEMNRPCRSVGSNALGNVLEMRADGWVTIQFDGAPGPVDMWAPFTKGHVVWAVAA